MTREESKPLAKWPDQAIQQSADHESKSLAKWCGQANQIKNYLGDQQKDRKASLRNLSGQAIQQSNHLGNKWKWQQSFGNNLAKPSSKAIIWDTYENTWKQTFGKSAAQGIQRNHLVFFKVWEPFTGDWEKESKANLWQNDLAKPSSTTICPFFQGIRSLRSLRRWSCLGTKEKG